MEKLITLHGWSNYVSWSENENDNTESTTIVKAEILDIVFEYFLNSSDFNGVTVSELVSRTSLSRSALLQTLSELVVEDSISIQGHENPHIVRFRHHEKETQLQMLNEAIESSVTVLSEVYPDDPRMGRGYQMVYETNVLCVYPSSTYLVANRNTNSLVLEPFTRMLALGSPQVAPLFFELEVLERYFTDPRYEFSFQEYSGQISILETDEMPSALKEADRIFLESFGLGRKSDGERVVVAFPIDLTRLTKEHQMHWHHNQCEVECLMVKEYYDNTILGEWTSSISMFTAFIEEQKAINELSVLMAGLPLFRVTFEGDNRPRAFTFFNIPTTANYESFVLLLDKMLSDNINKEFFEDACDTRDKGTLQLLEEWLRGNYRFSDQSSYVALLAPLRKVRKERQIPAHKIEESMYDKGLFTKQMALLREVYYTLHTIRMIFQKHPRCRRYVVPENLENCKVREF